MPSSRYLISSQTLTTAAASVTFSSIPATYTDLVLRISSRGSANNRPYELWVYPNNSQTATYSSTWIRGNGATASSSRYSNQTEMYAGYQGSALDTANSFGSTEIYIPNYAGSQNKVLSGIGMEESNESSDVWMQTVASLWQDTTPISSLVVDSAGNFVSGSSFYLYGLKNS